jgi:hypothetical protein
MHLLPVQTLLTQSAGTLQVLVSAHLEHEPPQSTSVSVPSFVPLVQLAVWHLPLVQLPERQSAATEQPAPTAHLFVVLQEPPQSTSVSEPFLTVSLHAAALQTLVELSQTP